MSGAINSEMVRLARVSRGKNQSEVAAALGYSSGLDATLRARFDHVLGTLVRLVGGGH